MDSVTKARRKVIDETRGLDSIFLIQPFLLQFSSSVAVPQLLYLYGRSNRI